MISYKGRRFLGLLLVFTLVLSTLMPAMTFAEEEVQVLTTNFIKVHIGDLTLTTSIIGVDYTEEASPGESDWISMSPQGGHYNSDDDKLYVSSDIKAFRVHYQNPSQTVVYAPASNYFQGTEGGGTINYRLDDEGILGALEIDKVVTGDPGDDTDFTITITGPNGFTHQDTITQGTTLSFPGLAVGDYTITETIPSGYLDIDAITASVIDGETEEVTVYNGKEPSEPDPGTITINKEILNWPDFGEDIPEWWIPPHTDFVVSYEGPDTTGSVIISETTPAVLTNLTTGAYIFTEAGSDYYSTSPSTINVTLDEGGSESVTFTNSLDRHDIWGEKVITGEAIAVSTDLSGFEFYVDYDDDGQHDAMEPSATSDSNGDFHITGVLPGEYKVREVADPGYTLVWPAEGYYTVNFRNNAQYLTLEFVNEYNENGSITIYKDLMGWPVWEGDDPDWWNPPSTEFTVNYTGPTTGSVIISETTPAVITDLETGTYTFTELVDSNLFITSPASFTVEFETGPSSAITLQEQSSRMNSVPSMTFLVK